MGLAGIQLCFYVGRFSSWHSDFQQGAKELYGYSVKFGVIGVIR